MKTKCLLSAVLIAAQLFCGSAFAAPAVSAAPAVPAAPAAPASASNAPEAEPQGEVFVSPDFIWSEETPGEFQVRFTITNGSNTVIPETEVRITLPDAALQFDAEASFSGQAPASGSITADGRELLLELTDFQVGETFAVSAGGNAEDAVSAEELRDGSGTEEHLDGSGIEELRDSPGAMNISLVLRGYGEEHATALDYRLPDPVPEPEETPEPAEEVPEMRTLIMISASLTGSGMENVTADIVDAPLSGTMVFMNKNNEYSLYNMHFNMGKEADGSPASPFTLLRLVPFMAAGAVLLILYYLYCIWDVRRRARVFKFDPLLKTNEKR